MTCRRGIPLTRFVATVQGAHRVTAHTITLKCIALCALLLFPSLTAAQTIPALSQALTLKSHGGVELKVPAWSVQRSDDSVSVLARTPKKTSKGGFLTLVVAVEEGPSKTEVVDWTLVRDNILGAAKGAGSDLSLALAGDWSGAEAFKGQRFEGVMTRAEREVSVRMVALLASGVMVTVTALGPQGSDELTPIAEAVAASVTRSAQAP